MKPVIKQLLSFFPLDLFSITLKLNHVCINYSSAECLPFMALICQPALPTLKPLNFEPLLIAVGLLAVLCYHHSPSLPFVTHVKLVPLYSHEEVVHDVIVIFPGPVREEAGGEHYDSFVAARQVATVA